MTIAKRASAAALALLAASLFVGCTQAPAAPGAKPSSAPSSTAADTRPATRAVKVVEVIDPLTVKATPAKESDSLYGETFTVHLTDLRAPSKGECGYDGALSFAEDALTKGERFLSYDSIKSGWIDAKGEHRGVLAGSGANDYREKVLTAGYAGLSSDGAAYLKRFQDLAQERNLGLWAECPDFFEN